MTRVLVTCGGGFQGLGVLRALHLAGVETYVCDVYRDNPARYTAHHYLVCPPLSTGDIYAAFLLETCRRERIDCVIPATALDLTLLSRIGSSLRAEGTTVAVCPQPLLDRLLDKHGTMSFLASHDLPIQPAIDPRLHDFSFPLIGKPLGGWGGRGIETLTVPADLQRLQAHTNLATYVWTRRLDRFTEFSADFAIGRHQSVSPIVVRLRLRTSGGFAVVSESAGDAEVTALFGQTARALAAASGFGLFNVQVIRPDGAGTAPFISDVNPRIGTSATHGLGEGINLPAWLLATIHNAPAAGPVPARRRVKNIRLLTDLTIPILPRRPRGVVFDLDDTLVDHRRWLWAKMQALYPACFHAKVDSAAYQRAVAQLIEDHEWSRLIDRTLELLGLSASLRDEAIATYRAITIPETPLFDDVAPVLSALHAEGIKTAILTDNPPATQRSKIAHSAPLHAMDASIFARECGGEKPHPAAFAQAAQALALPPAELVMVGDNRMRDGEGAIRAGYTHAFVVRRGGRVSNGLARSVSVDAGAISEVPNLVCVLRACMDAPQ